ncbi:MAG TPA: hypothetical protein VGN43_02850 [Steroidobacteraceae bacterium]|nr:hypothetical protein [Steroidobacteraceae bacterium]
MSRASAAGSGRSANRALIGVLTMVAALALWVPAPPAGAQGAAAGVSAADGCGPVDGLHFVCGAHHPEDMARIPGTPWAIVSAFAPHGGLQVLDTRALTLRPWHAGSPVRRDAGKRIGAADCPGPLQSGELYTQGLSLRVLRPDRYRLYAVNHGGRESIEIFDVSLASGIPVRRWRGCVLMPAGDAANAVSSFPDGTIIATVLNLPGTTKADFVRGKPTGGVFEWQPGTERFRLLPGTELPGNNGLTASPDGKTFYVVAFGLHAIYRYSRSDTRRPIRAATAPGFMPDNVHWDDGRLIAAGMTYDEPACGGIRRVVNGHADAMLCHRGYVVATLDSRTLHYTVIAQGGPNPAFNGATTGLIIGSRLWISSYQADRVAYRVLPDAKPGG